MDSPVSASYLAVGTLGLQRGVTMPDFTWILEIQTHVLLLVHQELYPLS